MSRTMFLPGLGLTRYTDDHGNPGVGECTLELRLRQSLGSQNVWWDCCGGKIGQLFCHIVQTGLKFTYVHDLELFIFLPLPPRS